MKEGDGVTKTDVANVDPMFEVEMVTTVARTDVEAPTLSDIDDTVASIVDPAAFDVETALTEVATTEDP